MGLRICEILNVEIEERWKIEGDSTLYHINSTGQVITSEGVPIHTIKLCNIINGKYNIVKLPILNSDELECVRFYAKHGYRWFARDASGVAYTFKGKPNKYENKGWWMTVGESSLNLPMDLSFLDWEDEEPYYYDGQI